MGMWLTCGHAASQPVSSPVEERAFSLLPGTDGRSRRHAGRPGILSVLALVVLAALRSALPIHAQHPAELVGRVLDPSSGAPVEAARLELVEAGRVALSDAAGRFRFRGLEPGRYTLRVTRLGYHDRSISVELRNGRTTRLDVELSVRAHELEELRVAAEATPAGGVRIERSAIERSGARTAGDVIRAVPGAVVRATSPGGPQTVSIRGSGEDAVLVLVDGVPLNDPVTGEADLSTVPAGAIESVTVLPGAQSARYGPRAEAGVILIETRAGVVERGLSGGLGSLGARGAGVEWGGRSPVSWGAGASWSALDGRFSFELPPEAGGGSGERENADVSTLGVWAGATHEVAGGTLTVRTGFESMDRGLPGRGYAPSRHARQRLDRARASAAWRRVNATSSFSLSLAGVDHRLRFRDPRPPLGLPFDDRAEVRSYELRSEVERRPTAPTSPGYGAGFEARWQRITADGLAADAPDGRLDAGLFAHASAGREVAGVPVALGAQLRLDRDPADGGWTPTHSVTLSVPGDRVAVRLAHRNSYSPPTLGDQYFREAIGVAPNPDLRAERVPSELEVGIDLRGDVVGATFFVGAAAFRGDVRDMILWAPDFRFVWSPRNFDVRRRGAEARAEVEAFAGRLRLTASHSYARVTYDDAGVGEDVQVIYRPRHTTSLAAAWQDARWRLGLEARRVGARNTAPATVNVLPAYWTTGGAVSRTWRAGSWDVHTTLRAERLFDEKSTLIFGFPEPGRVVRLDLRLTPDAGNAPFERRSR